VSHLSEVHLRPAIVSRKLLTKMGWVMGLFLLAFANGRLYGQAPAAAPVNGLPAGGGRDLVAVACSQCHALRTIMALRDGPVGWKILVDDMILRGAQLGPQEAATAIRYLSENFGPAAGPMQVGKGETQSLPSGSGRELIQTHCALCHDLSRVTGSKRSKQEWSYTVTGMMSKVSGMATPKEIEIMSSYLAAQFGKNAE
jgi:mono/diheme cytochrome c family protein